MAADYRVNVHVNVSDGQLTALENRLNALASKGHAANVGATTGALTKSAQGAIGAAAKQAKKDMSKAVAASFKDKSVQKSIQSSTQSAVSSAFANGSARAKAAARQAEAARIKNHRIQGQPSNTQSPRSASIQKAQESAAREKAAAEQKAAKQLADENRRYNNTALARSRQSSKLTKANAERVRAVNEATEAERKAVRENLKYNSPQAARSRRSAELDKANAERAKAERIAASKAKQAAQASARTSVQQTGQAIRAENGRKSAGVKYGESSKATPLGATAKSGMTPWGTPLSPNAAKLMEKGIKAGSKSTAKAYREHTKSYKTVGKMLDIEKQITAKQWDIIESTNNRTRNAFKMSTGMSGDRDVVDRILTDRIRSSRIEADNLRKQSALMTEQHWSKLSKAQQVKLNNAVTGANASSSKRIQQEIKSLKGVNREIDKLTRQGMKIPDSDVMSRENVNRQLKDLVSTRTGMIKTLKSHGGSVPQRDLVSVTDNIAASDRRISNFQAKLNQLRHNSNIKIKTDVLSGSAMNKLNALESRMHRIQSANITTSSQNAMSNLRAEQQRLQIAAQNFERTGYTSGKADGNNMPLAFYQQNFDKAYRAAQNYVAVNERINKQAVENTRLNYAKNRALEQSERWITKNSKAQKDYGSRIKETQGMIKSATTQSELLAAKEQFAGIRAEAEKAGKATQKFSSKMRIQGSRLASYYMASFGMMQGMMLVTDAFRNVLEVDTAMTELRRVTDLTTSQYEAMYDKMSASAKEYGATLSDTISSTADWVKQGFDVNEALGLAEVSSQYQHIGDIDKSEANENLITAYNGYKEELLKLYDGDAVAAVGYAGDVFNEIGNNFAITSGQVGDAMTRAASALNVGGNTFQESVGMITGVTEVTQDPEKAGSAMKILSLRLRGMKGELEAVEEGAGEGVESISKMQTQILNFTSGTSKPVNIFDENGDFKSTYEIMNDIADIWDELSSVDQAQLLETIAGKHRANDVAALIENWERVEESTLAAIDAEGSAAIEHEKYLNSLQGKITTLQASWESLSNTMIDSDFLKGFLGMVTGAVNGLDSIISTTGMLNFALTSMFAISSIYDKKFLRYDKQTRQLSTPFGYITPGSKDNGFKSALNFKKYKPQLYDNKFKQNLRAESAYLKHYATAYTQTGDRISAADRALAATRAKYGSEFAPGANAQNFASNNINRYTAINSKSLGMTLQEYTKMERAYHASAAAYDGSMKSKVAAIREFNRLQAMDARNAQTIANYQQKYPNGATVVTKEQQKEYRKYLKAQRDGTDNASKFAGAIKESDKALSSQMTTASAAGKQITKGSYAMNAAKTSFMNFGMGLGSMFVNGLMGAGIGIAISALFSAFDTLIVTEKELSDKVDDATSSFSEQRKTMLGSRSEFKDAVKEYKELSKGVNAAGENIGLTTDEFARYQEVTSQIAEQVPTMVKGYDKEGNAILRKYSTVEAYTEAYDDMLHKQNRELISTKDDIEKDYRNKIDNLFADGKTIDAMNKFNDIFESSDVNATIDSFDEEIASGFDSTKTAQFMVDAIKEAYKDAGLEDEIPELKSQSEDSNAFSNFIKDAQANNPEIVQAAMEGVEDEFEVATADMQILAEALISDAFVSGVDNKNISDEVETFISGLVYDMDAGFMLAASQHTGGLEGYINDMIDSFGGLDAVAKESLENVIDLKSQYDEGDITYGQLAEATDTFGIDVLSAFDENTQSLIKTSLGLDEVQENYEAVNDEIGNLEGADKLIKDLSNEELEVAAELSVKGDYDSLEKFQADISDATLYSEVDVDIVTETEDYANLVSALGEEEFKATFMGTGVGAELEEMLVSRYSGLEGFDENKLFEQTAIGVRLNEEAYRAYESALTAATNEKFANKIADLTKKQEELNVAIKEAEDAGNTNTDKYKENLDELETTNELLESTRMLASQYAGLTSAYMQWKAALSTTNENAQFLELSEGIQAAKDAYSEGWVGTDDFISFVQLMTNEDLTNAPIERVVEVYENRIGITSKYFNGSTSGLTSFVTDAGKATTELGNKLEGSGFTQAADGTWSIDLAYGDDVKLANKLKISTEQFAMAMQGLQAMGWDIDLGFVQNSADYVAQQAQSAQEIIEGMNGGDYSKTNTVEIDTEVDSSQVESELTKAQDAANEIKEINAADRTKTQQANLDYYNAQMDVLLKRKQEAERPSYMELDASNVESDMQAPLKTLQNYRSAVEQLEYLELHGMDTSEVQTEIDGYVEQIDNLSDSTKLKLGIDPNATQEQIEEQLANGNISIPTALDLQIESNELLLDIANSLRMITGQDPIPVEVPIETHYTENGEEAPTVPPPTEPEDEEVERTVTVKDIFTTGALSAVGNWLFGRGSSSSGASDSTATLTVSVTGDEKVKTVKESLNAINGMAASASVSVTVPDGVQGKVNTIKEALNGINGMSANTSVKTSYSGDFSGVGQAPKRNGKVSYTADFSGIPKSAPELKGKVVYTGDTSGISTKGPTKYGKVIYSSSGGGGKKGGEGTPANGTATPIGASASFASGSAFADGTIGKAFESGDWRVKGSGGVALGGEMGQEMVVRDGRYFTIGDNSAEFFKYKPGDIIFNAEQTKQIFEKGKIQYGSKRGKAFAGGTAAKSSGRAFVQRYTPSTPATGGGPAGGFYVGGSGTGAGSGSGSGDSGKKDKSNNKDTKKDFKEVFDWIEVAIDRIERLIERLGKTADSVYKTWAQRSRAITQSITQTRKEIDLQWQGYNRYMKQANGVTISKDKKTDAKYKKLVQNGKIDIETIKNEKLAEKIKEYQEW